MIQGAQVFFIGLLGSILIATQGCAQTTGTGTVAAVYVAITPCSSGTRPLPGIPKEAECELIKWELKFFKSKSQQTDGTYILDCNYGLPHQGTKGLLHGGRHLHREGKWIMIKGTRKNPSAILYTLDPEKPEISVSFIRLNDNLMHLLDSHQQLMIGNGGSSYTLNKLSDHK